MRIGAEINVLLRELKASLQDESNFQGMSFQVRHINGITISE